MGQFRLGGFGGLTPVVKNLLIINVLFFVADFSLGQTMNIDLADFLGLHFPLSEKFQVYQIITYMFMHGGFQHLFFNMFALWMFGNTIEQVWGPKKFLIYYFVTGIGAAIIHYSVAYFEMLPVLNAIAEFNSNPTAEGFIAFTNSDYLQIATYGMRDNYAIFADQFNQLLRHDEIGATQLAVDYMSQYKIDFLNSPNVVGASGAVFGLLLAFGMLFPETRIYLYFAIPIKAKYFVMLYGAAELVFGLTGSMDNVAHYAHLGGMIFGFILIKYWKKNRSY